jgi:uncharacterized protein (TIGR03435 family)
MRRAFTVLCALLVLLASARVTPGQTPTAPVSFEVSSVKPVERTPGRRPKYEDDARVEYRRETVFNLLLRAYGMRAWQVSGPSWIKENYYDVLATIPKGATRTDTPAMLRQLLQDRFRLSVHREQRATPVYVITVGAGGPKFPPCVPAEKARPTNPEAGLEATAPGECPANCVLTRGEASMLIQANTLTFLANGMTDGSDRPVLDRTGLTGNFKIAFECAQAMGAQEDPQGYPTMSAALQKLGLKLESRREEIEYLIIDKGDKNPTGN